MIDQNEINNLVEDAMCDGDFEDWPESERNWLLDRVIWILSADYKESWLRKILDEGYLKDDSTLKDIKDLVREEAYNDVQPYIHQAVCALRGEFRTDEDCGQ